MSCEAMQAGKGQIGLHRFTALTIAIAALHSTVHMANDHP